MSHDHGVHGNQVVERMALGMDPLEHMCRRLEAMVHEQGWDKRPEFYSLSLLGDLREMDPEVLRTLAGTNETPLLGALAAQCVPMPDIAYHDPATGMMSLLSVMTEMVMTNQQDAVAKTLHRMVPEGFYGFGLMCEAWTLPDSVPEEEQRIVSREHTMHEHPDRVELRTLTVATVDGRVALLNRRRGDFPEYSELDPTEDDLKGRIPTAIRLFTSLFEEFDQWRRGAAEVQQNN